MLNFIGSILVIYYIEFTRIRLQTKDGNLIIIAALTGVLVNKMVRVWCLNSRFMCSYITELLEISVLLISIINSSLHFSEH